MSPSLLLSPLTFALPVIAHRGASAHAPENTMAAFQRAHQDGALWIETDVKLSYDGAPLLMHDDTLDRTTNGKGAVADMKWGDIGKLDAGSWFDPAFGKEHVPHLAECVRYIVENDMRINLELKPCPGRARATSMVTLIEITKIWPEKALPPLISSFDIESLVIAANLHPECPRGLVLNTWQDNWSDLIGKVNAQSIHLEESVLTAERVALLKNSGLVVLAYVVNTPDRARELLSWGVSAVFSDDPAAVLKSL